MASRLISLICHTPIVCEVKSKIIRYCVLSLASILPLPVRVRSTGDGHCSPSRTNGHHSTCTKARSIQSRSTHTSPTELVNDVTGHPLWDGRCIIDSDVVRQWLCWAYTLRQSPHCALTWELGSSEKNFLPVVFRTFRARHKRLSYGNIWLITLPRDKASTLKTLK